MGNITVTSQDISLVKQRRQRRFLKIQLVDRNWNTLCSIKGRFTAATLSIDASEGIRRTANITMRTDSSVIELPTQNIIIDLQKDLALNYYIKLWAGIEDNNDRTVKWYKQGLFVINKSDYNYNPTTRTLSLGLTDIMCDLTGDRAGILHAYTSLVKNEQRIDDVMKNVLELSDFNAYNITPITPLQSIYDADVYAPNTTDYMIPYDKNFEVGVSAYEILEWLVSLYPYYEIGFDVDGTFFCRKKILDQDDSMPVIDGYTLTELVISEDTSIDWFATKNFIEVWGKDGLYYGEAKDENPDSPFQVSATQPFRYVISGSEDGIDTNNICDRYKDTALASTLLKEQADLENTIARLSKIENPTQAETNELTQAQNSLGTNKARQANNVAISGDSLAQQWANQKLYEKSRIYDSISITTVGMPFLNDVGFKMSYRSKVDETMRPYKIENIAHDYIAGTTTLGMVRFYDDQCTNLWDKLDIPVITSYNIMSGVLAVNIDRVRYAERYELYIDNKLAATSTGTTLSYAFEEWQEGEHTVYVIASADYFRSSQSITISVEYIISTLVTTNTGNHLATSTGDRIKISEVSE